MKICKNCNKEISDKAIICPHCGCKVRKPFLKRLLSLLLIILVGIIIVCVASNHESPIDMSAITFEKCDLQTMLDELSENALMAKNTYEDKYIEVAGRIAVIDSDGKYIAIEPDNDEFHFLDTMRCTITKNDEQVNFITSHKIGDTIVIKGHVTSVGEILGYSMEVYEFLDN